MTNALMREVLQWAYEEGKLVVGSWSVENAEGRQQLLLNFMGSKLSWGGSFFAVARGKEDYPCTGVTWYGSAAFCNYLSEMEGLTPCYDAHWRCDWTADGYRLPTEAEWEYAAKGGLNGVKTKYAGSDNLNAVGWYLDNPGGASHPVGKKAANELGLYDMVGNVAEWCWEWSSIYSSSPSTDPHGPTAGWWRVLRGGSYNSRGFLCSVSRRGRCSPYEGFPYFGFRLARSVPNQ